MPASDAEKAEKGHIVFGENQERRFIQFDKMALFLNGDTPTSGQKAITTTMAKLLDAGKAQSKSSKKVTLLLGFVGDELLPPYIILLSHAKEGNQKYDTKMFSSFKEVKGRYGLEKFSWHDNTFSSTANGGTKNDTFLNWILEQIVLLYHDACDLPGFRVIMKADSSTGRDTKDFLAGLMFNGFHFFPGLSNGTEVGQEMDQLFASFQKAASIKIKTSYSTS